LTHQRNETKGGLCVGLDSAVLERTLRSKKEKGMLARGSFGPAPFGVAAGNRRDNGLLSTQDRGTGGGREKSRKLRKAEGST